MLISFSVISLTGCGGSSKTSIQLSPCATLDSIISQYKMGANYEELRPQVIALQKLIVIRQGSEKGGFSDSLGAVMVIQKDLRKTAEKSNLSKSAIDSQMRETFGFTLDEVKVKYCDKELSTQQETKSSPTSEPSSMKSDTYIQTMDLMYKLDTTGDTPFTNYWVNKNGGKNSYCVTLEKSAEIDSGVTLNPSETADFVSACFDFLGKKGL